MKSSTLTTLIAALSFAVVPEASVRADGFIGGKPGKRSIQSMRKPLISARGIGMPIIAAVEDRQSIGKSFIDPRRFLQRQVDILPPPGFHCPV